MQRAHVLVGVELGIAQTNHGAKAGIARMGPGDGFVFYSPKTSYPDGDPLQEFTAIGRVAPGEPWQAEDGEWRPWRRKVDYDGAAHPVPIAPCSTCSTSPAATATGASRCVAVTSR
ncbi:hypothetical protein GCM10025881_24290 [Pseudolysinimonas kribbensis]|uniref:EVE domain-containing protein n=1 Tax=Pseudolysinimonas kribbensis TaxID=433641 RepID=A0ABQ6K9E7_9MICO|nr:hypothetical protein GCM10025881_24290 [Pseudolysinimonas kribbensis]